MGVQPETTIRAMLERHVAAAAPATGALDPIVEAHALAQAGDVRRRPDRRGRAGRAARRTRPARRTRRVATPGARCRGGHGRHRPARRPGSAVSDARDPPGPARVPRNGIRRTRRSERPCGARDKPRRCGRPARIGRSPRARRGLRSRARGMARADAHDRAYGDDVARRSMLAVFDVLGSSRRAGCTVPAQDGNPIALSSASPRLVCQATIERHPCW